MKPIILDNVSKVYRLRGRKPTLAEIVGNVAHVFQRNGRPRRTQISALKNVSFEMEQGEVLGIIGPNGAGKTTVLSLMAGVTRPTSGQITINGRVAPLIALGAGFHPELTGRENIYLNGIILGMSKREIERKFEAIVDFAELQGFLDTPVKRYSSGMYARLGFSVAIYTELDILLVDEVLAVGDWSFQEKCLERMRRFKGQGVSIVFVTHNLDMVRRLCDRVILMKQGRSHLQGNPAEAISAYFETVSEEGTNYRPDGTKSAELLSVEILDQEKKATTVFRAGDCALVRMRVKFNEDTQGPEFGFFIRRTDRLLVMSTGSKDLGTALDSCQAGEVIEVEFPFVVNLLNGVYHLGVEVRAERFGRYLDFVANAVTMTVNDGYSHGGVADLQPRCMIVSR